MTCGNVRAGERQVQEGPDKAPKVSRISNMRPGLDGDLGLCVHRRKNHIAVHHASSLKNIERKLILSDEEPVHLMLYGDSQKMMEGLEILHGEFQLEDRYGLLQKCCAGCGEDNVINVKQHIYCICVASEDE
jgi:hypothetical protein